ncbi:MAG: EVE domain-containing protein [Planctomycetes bacterium]|uniref:EVE domain-containing protein n=1 Tax=Candidatus Wunengus californicus TaxID=3367619 RepID=UPI004025C2F7|nr:EVE domain-containing protein [Planctomycetota bacterium]
MNYWLIKSPFRTRSWPDILIKGSFKLYGIRNHQAKNNISMMQRGDVALFYHSRSGKNVFGIMQVSKPPYQDPTTKDANWLAIDFKPIKTFETPISLGRIKAEPTLQGIGLIKQPRLSVIRLSKNEFEKIINLVNSKSY